MAESKVCRKCKQEKDISNFGYHKETRDNLRHECHTCRLKLELLHREERRDKNYQNKYGITLGQYELILKSQNEVCAICGQPETTKDYRYGKLRELSVDHDEKSCKVRGLLCEKCNRGIGHFYHDPNLLELAAKYLRRSGHGKS